MTKGLPFTAWRFEPTPAAAASRLAALSLDHYARTRNFLDGPVTPVRVRYNLYACGDHLDTSSTEGAMRLGQRAADAVADDLERNAARSG